MRKLTRWAVIGVLAAGLVALAAPSEAFNPMKELEKAKENMRETAEHSEKEADERAERENLVKHLGMLAKRKDAFEKKETGEMKLSGERREHLAKMLEKISPGKWQGREDLAEKTAGDLALAMKSPMEEVNGLKEQLEVTNTKDLEERGRSVIESIRSSEEDENQKLSAELKRLENRVEATAKDLHFLMKEEDIEKELLERKLRQLDRNMSRLGVAKEKREALAKDLRKLNMKAGKAKKESQKEMEAKKSEMEN